jgi:hypothetical protein
MSRVRDGYRAEPLAAVSANHHQYDPAVVEGARNGANEAMTLTGA